MRPDLRIEQAFLELSGRRHDGRRQARACRVRRDRRRTPAPHRGVPRQGRRAQLVAAASAKHEGVKIRHPILGPSRASSRCSTSGCATRSGRDPRARRPRARGRRLQRLARQPGRGPAGPRCGGSGTSAGDRGVRVGRSPATGEAVRQFRAEGRRHIAVASLFLAPGFLPDRAAELAVEAGAIAVSEPLGAHPELARTILARYAVGAVELVPV